MVKTCTTCGWRFETFLTGQERCGQCKVPLHFRKPEPKLPESKRKYRKAEHEWDEKFEKKVNPFYYTESTVRSQSPLGELAQAHRNDEQLE